jgi:hypothetical protein
MRTLVLGIALALAGCVTTPTPTQHKQIATSCEVAASAMDSLNAARIANRITAAQHSRATEIYARTVPVCEPPADSLDSVKYAALAAAVAELSNLAGAAK